jgi:tetratricopeptide (TPR) repeat protein
MQLAANVSASDPSSFASLAEGELVANRYRIVRLLGRGGMGEVYEARDELLNEAIALKTLRADLAEDEAFVSRFQKEIRLARKVTHVNVCRLFEAGIHRAAKGEERSLLFFTMELLHGETLAERMRRSGPMPKAAAFPLIVQIANGLQAAHDKGVVHADLKPGNVILVPETAGERAVITDFGLARIDPRLVPLDQATTFTTVGTIAGTLGYMSPEQLTGGTLTPASDLYSFGIILFEMATGALPFDARNAGAAAMDRGADKHISARASAPGIDPRWDQAISRSLHKEPSRRIGSARELAALFEEEHRPTIVRPLFTRRELIHLGLAGGVAAAGAYTAWRWWHRPYQPKAEALEWYANGVLALHSMTFDTARKQLERAVAADPKFVLALASLARAYSELDYSELAQTTLLRAVNAAQEVNLSKSDELKFRAMELIISREFAKAAPLLERIEREAAEADKPAAALESGWLAQQREDTEAAAAGYQRALRLNSRYAAAHLRLGYILGRRRKVDEALQSFERAEDLYNASSGYEGVIETLLQRASLLDRANRAAEAEPLVNRALAMARSQKNSYQEIRLQLQEGVTARNLGDPARAEMLAREAIDKADAERMDNLASSGLVDLGNTFLQRGDFKTAEPLFRRALDVAKRGGVGRHEARARGSLASLCEADHRPEEALQFARGALPFYRQAGYRRELVQIMILMAGAHEQLAEFEEGARVLDEALPNAMELHEDPIEAQTRERLGDILHAQGEWPKALAEYERAARLRGPGVPIPQLDRASLNLELGHTSECERELTDLEAALKLRPNRQALLMLRTIQAQSEYDAGRFAEAEAMAMRLAEASVGDVEGTASADLLQGLATLRVSRGTQGLDLIRATIAQMDQAKLRGEAAVARLAAAQALAANAQLPVQKHAAWTLASEAIGFYEPRQVLESLWRGHAVASHTASDANEGSAHRARAAETLNGLRKQWPSATIDSYLARPEVKLILSYI